MSEYLENAAIEVGPNDEKRITFTYEGKSYGVVFGPHFFAMIEKKNAPTPVVMELMVFNDD